LEGEPEQTLSLLILTIQTVADTGSVIVPLLFLLVVLIVVSGLVSGSENAFFSLSPTDVKVLESETSSKSAIFALRLINEPDRLVASRRLLATILILNNFINISIIILSAYLLNNVWIILGSEVAEWIRFTFQVVLITFMLVLFGEVIPKIYATQNNLKLVRLTSIPLFYSGKLLLPFVWMLTKSTQLIDRRIKKQPDNVSLEELNQAIEIASEDDNIEEKNILKGLVNYGNISVKQIMRSRIDVSALDSNTSQEDLFKAVQNLGYSRLPVFTENFDNIIGILYIKDLLPLLTGVQNEPWLNLIRPPFFVPANKKIDDLLAEFQEKRIHMAVVVDEYGGSSGIVTMEDVLEEIFGDLKDEFDEDELVYSKLNDNTYIFEGKILLTDLCRIFDLRTDFFEEIKGEAETLAGMLLEINRDILKRGDALQLGDFHFKVESADARRIKRIKVVHQPVTSEAFDRTLTDDTTD
jgi:putative hemolysin